MSIHYLISDLRIIHRSNNYLAHVDQHGLTMPLGHLSKINYQSKFIWIVKTSSHAYNWFCIHRCCFASTYICRITENDKLHIWHIFSCMFIVVRFLLVSRMTCLFPVAHKSHWNWYVPYSYLFPCMCCM